jgi:hypothetical protein
LLLPPLPDPLPLEEFEPEFEPPPQAASAAHARSITAISLLISERSTS